MSIIDLEHEFRLALENFSDIDRDALQCAGVPADVVVRALVGVAGVVAAGEVYQPIEGGRRHLIVPVRVGHYVSPQCPEPDRAVARGELVDLLAFRLDAPETWWLRRGVAVWLGACLPQYLDPPPVLIHRTPLDWLRNGGEGIVILADYPVERRDLLLSFRMVAVDDPSLGRELQRSLERPYAIPPIMVRVFEEPVE